MGGSLALYTSCKVLNDWSIISKWVRKHIYQMVYMCCNVTAFANLVCRYGLETKDDAFDIFSMKCSSHVVKQGGYPGISFLFIG